MFIIACLVGFMGPFGTYADGDLLDRIGRWADLLAGAYVLVRPVIAGARILAQHTALPRRQLLLWGALLSSFPVSLVWTWGSAAIFHTPMRYAVTLPFSSICALAVLTVVGWAEQTDQQLDRDRPNADHESAVAPPPATPPALEGGGQEASQPASALTSPRLRARLSPAFQGPILALQSEDHYVRVHGETQSELVLIRLRDAIAEMDGLAGAQVHRSWWVAREAVSKSARLGRAFTIHLKNGTAVPVARESIERLRQLGFIT